MATTAAPSSTSSPSRALTSSTGAVGISSGVPAWTLTTSLPIAIVRRRATRQDLLTGVREPTRTTSTAARLEARSGKTKRSFSSTSKRLATTARLRLPLPCRRPPRGLATSRRLTPTMTTATWFCSKSSILTRLNSTRRLENGCGNPSPATSSLATATSLTLPIRRTG